MIILRKGDDKIIVRVILRLILRLILRGSKKRKSLNSKLTPQQKLDLKRKKNRQSAKEFRDEKDNNYKTIKMKF